MTRDPSPTAGQPRFSIVTAVYNVEGYLPEFIESIEQQRFDPRRIEVVAVDDGSTDGSLELLQRWAGSASIEVKVFAKANGGQGSARNMGLEHATGEWLTFADPDDRLGPDYLGAADRFAAEHPDLELLSARPLVLMDATGRITRTHPRRWQYARGNRRADLIDEPSVFLGVSPGSFYRHDRIRALGLRFDERIRPNFEDAHYAARFLLAQPRPAIGLLRDSVYVYRKRADGSSTLQSSYRHPGRYGDVLEFGHIDLLERSRRPDGSIPAWVQQLIIYELSWYLTADERISTDVVLPDELTPRFHELFGRIVRMLDPAVVARHRSRPLRAVWSDILRHGYRDEDWHMPFVVRGKVDRDMGLQRIGYRLTGSVPGERFVVDGTEVPVAFGKTRAHRYYGRVLMDERILWIPAGTSVQAFLNGTEVPVRWGWQGPQRRRRRRRPIRARLVSYRRSARRFMKAVRRGRARRMVTRGLLARTWPLQGRLARSWLFRGYRDAWVLMDRVNDGDDNGERLFEYLRARRPDINAWFALAPWSRQWARLRAADSTDRGRRLVPWGSFRWRMLMLNAHWLLSSHADRGLVEPPAVTRIARGRPWKFGFLEHGIIKDDLSLWLNQRDIDFFVASTPAELESIAADGTSYVVTHKETRNTGLARFDRLLEKGRAVRVEDRDLVIVAPTWRTYLSLPVDPRTQRRLVDRRFVESSFAQAWLGLLRSEAVRDAVAARGWRLGFMPHPNLQEVLPQLDLPPWIERLTFVDHDAQSLYARCALLVTDYSSVAFNLAYLDRPLVYFQFDRAEMMRGAHMGRQGYFDYRQVGFGPVVEDLAAAEDAMVAAIRHGPRPTPVYQARIDATFPLRDGGTCARVVAAVEELSRPWSAPSAGSEQARP